MNCQSVPPPSDISFPIDGDDDRKRAVKYLSRRSFINPNIMFSSALLDEPVNQEQSSPISLSRRSFVNPNITFSSSLLDETMNQEQRGPINPNLTFSSALLDEPMNQERKGPSSPAAAAYPGRTRILIVDDSSMNRY